ncbi:MAG TPA: transcription termination factor Rho, partial [Acidimicrobiales bacterium]|nr:transcription termination factor Rho [Acidimicrobiales bacterium]
IQLAKRFLGAARNTEDAGSLTILATAAVGTGSKIDDAILDELREVVTTEIRLDHSLAERRVHPPIDVAASGTINDDRLLGDDLDEVVALRQKIRSGAASEEGDTGAATPIEQLLQSFGSSTAPSV